MKSNSKTTTSQNWTAPGPPLSEDEFKKGIKKAEKDHFDTIEESKKMMEQWRRLRASQ